MLKFNVTMPDYARGLEATLFGIKADYLARTKEYLREHQAGDQFPDDEKDYSTLVRINGREQKRQIRTVRPQYLKIGSQRSPTSISFVATGNVGDMALAARFAYQWLRKRAPVHKGNYRNSITIRIKRGASGDEGVRVQSAHMLSKIQLDADHVIQIAPEVVRISKKYPSGYPYALRVEAGYYRNLYKRKLTKGVMYYVARQIQRKFRNRIAARFRYVGYKGGGTFPVIEIAAPGTFASKSSVPYKSTLARRRRILRGHK